MYNYVNYHITLHNRHEADSCLYCFLKHLQIDLHSTYKEIFHPSSIKYTPNST